MNATTQNADPAALEREATQIRADMDRTLSALEQKLSPQQMFDRSLTYLRDHSGDLGRTLGDNVKQNPIPVLLTAAGLAWWITSSMRSRSDSTDAYGTAPYDDTWGDEAFDTTSSGADASSSGGIRQKISDRVHQGAEAVRQRTQSLRQSLHSSTSATTGRMSGAMSSTRTRAQQAAQQAQYRAQSMLHEQPLIVGALAVAAGAIIGASLPTTQYENRTVGPIRDRTMEKAKEAGEQQIQTLRSKLQTKRDDMQVSGRAN